MIIGLQTRSMGIVRTITPLDTNLGYGARAHKSCPQLRNLRTNVSRMSVPEQVQASTDSGDNRNWQRRPAHQNVFHVFNLIFVGMGIFFLVSGYNTWAAVQPVAGGKTTTGIVVSVAYGETCGRYGCSPNWTPTISFETASGTPQTFAGPTYSSQVETGQTVVVSYLPSNPAVAHDISASDGQALWLIGAGVFAIVMGLGSFILGYGALHRRMGLNSAREGSGWVGQQSIHSNQGSLFALAILMALTVVGFFVI